MQDKTTLKKDAKSDPCQRFEATKRENFRHSSRLEGINISVERGDNTIESVLKKYRVDMNG